MPASPDVPSEPAEKRLAFHVAAPDVAAEVSRWLAHLMAERRFSRHTLDAYARDLQQFLRFLAGYHGEKPDLAGTKVAAVTSGTKKN